MSKTAHGCSSQEDEIRSAARRNETQPRTISRGSQDGSTRRNVQQRAPIRLSLDLEFQPRRRDTNQETQRRSDPESFQYFFGETSNLLLVAQPPDAQATPSPNDSGRRTAEKSQNDKERDTTRRIPDRSILKSCELGLKLGPVVFGTTCSPFLARAG